VDIAQSYTQVNVFRDWDAVCFKYLNALKVPKHEIFDGGFFASKEPIWSPDS
jgi:hypothetical protein